MPLPRASVLIPVRDEEVLIEAAIRSILAEPVSDLEVVVVDDGSVDDTPRHLERLAREDRRVRVLRTGRNGLASALALGLAQAKGDILVRMDADDLSLPGRLTRQLTLLEKNPEIGLVGGRVVAAGLEGLPAGEGMQRYVAWQNELISHEAICRDLFIESPLVHPSIAARTALLRAAGGYREGDFPEDYDLFLRLLIGEGGRPTGTGRPGEGVRAVKLAGEPILVWRDRPRRFTRQSPRCRPEAIRKLKVHFLLRSYLAQRPEVVVWGAGRVGKSFARELLRQGVAIKAFIDIDPRKIGHTIHGARVLDPSGLSRLGGAFLIVAVGAPGARALIREELQGTDFVEGVNACFVA